jgi:hypothetical protein
MACRLRDGNRLCLPARRSALARGSLPLFLSRWDDLQRHNLPARSRQSRRLPTSTDSLHGHCGLSTSRAVHSTQSRCRFVPHRRPSLMLSQPRAKKSGSESRRVIARSYGIRVAVQVPVARRAAERLSGRRETSAWPAWIPDRSSKSSGIRARLALQSSPASRCLAATSSRRRPSKPSRRRRPKPRRVPSVHRLPRPTGHAGAGWPFEAARGR